MLAELATLTHDGRVRHMIRLGRDPASTGVLGELARGDGFARCMGLWGAAGARDGAAVERAVADPSQSVRRLAMHLVPSVCDDAAIGRVLGVVSQHREWRLLTRLSKAKRQRPIDGYVDAVATAGGRDWPRLLPAASAGVVAEHVGRFAEVATPHDWTRLADRHPAMVAGLLRGRADAAEPGDRRLQSDLEAALPPIARRLPDVAVDLVRLAARTIPPAALPLDELAARRPDAVATLLLDGEVQAVPRFTLPAGRLSAAVLDRWVRRWPAAGLGPVPAMLRRLPADRRAAVYDRCRVAWQDADGLLRPEVVAALAEPDRVAEARRHVAAATLSIDPGRRLAYAALLPWEQARAVADGYARDADAEVRGRAVAALVGAARFNASHTADAVAAVVERRFEQDPVRLQMVAALAGLPQSRWGAEHLAGLATVVRHALDAADASPGTLAGVERLLVGLVPFHPAWAGGQLAAVVAHRGMFGLGDVADRLTDAQVRGLAGPLTPAVRSWQGQEREPHLVAAARAFGRRLPAFAALAEAVEAIARHSISGWTAESAVAVLAEFDRPRAVRLMPQLVAADPTWVAGNTVRAFLLRRRQDLIGPALGRVAHAGRFGTGKTRYYLSEASGLWRLSPVQQRALAATLAEVVADVGRPIANVLSAVRQLGSLPAVPPTTLVALAGDDGRPAARDAALRALARVDDGSGLPTLLEALGDGRARVAIYALRGALAEMPADRVLALLRAAPIERVTVAKEVVRLIGGLRTDAAFEAVRAIEATSPHRDVRAAVVRAAWDYLDRPAAWDLIDRAVATGEPNLADPAGRIPVDGLTTAGRARLARVLAPLLGHADGRVRIKVLGRLRWLPLDDAERVLVGPLLAGVRSAVPDEQRAAAAAVFATYAGRATDAVAAMAGAVRQDRRAVRALADALVAAAQVPSGGDLSPAARATVDALAGDPVCAAVRAQLAVAALPDAAATLLGMAGELHPDAVTAAAAALPGAVGARGIERAEAIERALAAAAAEGCRRVAVAALVAAASADGWTADRRGRLARFRADPSPWVAAAAQFTFLPDEPETT